MTQPVGTASTSAAVVTGSWRQGAFGGLRAAVMLLTRLPTGHAPTSAAARAWASGWFPLVGAAIGSLTAAVLLGLAPLLGASLAAAGAVGAAILVTGALHEDGLADTADALGGARDRTQIFEILKDSRHGTYGVLALVLVVLMRIAALAQLLRLPGSNPAGATAAAGLIWAALTSRAAMVALLATLPYVTPAAVARSADVARAGPAPTALAAVFVAALGGGLLALGALPLLALGGALAGVALVTAAAGWRFAARAGGITGDFLGALQQLAELMALTALVALLR